MLNHRILDVCAPAGSLRRRSLHVAGIAATSIQRRGAVGSFRHAMTRLKFGPALTEADRWRTWQIQNTPSPSALEAQRNWKSASAPLISILTVAEGQTDKLWSATLRSLCQQSYGNWELCLVVSGADEAAARRVVHRVADDDPRIKIVTAAVDASPWSRRQQSLQWASGSFCAVMDIGDTLSPHALYMAAHTITEQSHADVYYCDEDWLTSKGERRAPCFKPAWSPELLLAYNYVGRLAVMRRALVVAAGGFAADMEDAQEWDLLLRMTERGARFFRLPACLYHRRHDSATATVNGPRSDVSPQARRALEAHLNRQGLQARAEMNSDGSHRVTWPLPRQPLVSIIIPSRNKLELIRTSIECLVHKTDYPHKEILIVDNGSTEPAVLEYYQEIERAGLARVVPFNREFNYSAACNAGAREASGELLLFLNNDIEVISPDWLEEMVRWGTRDGVGMVGTKLTYPNGVLQHAGVIVGMHLCGLIYNRLQGERWGVFGSPDTYRNYLAIMGACQMVPRHVFDEVGGFDEKYFIANSDVALCLRAWKAGYRCVYTPYAELLHHEGYTRGRTNPAEDIETTAWDLQDLKFDEDPYFHPGLSPHHAIPRLRLEPELSPRDFLRNQVKELLAHRKLDGGLDIFCDDAIQGFASHEAVTFAVPRLEKRPRIEDPQAAMRFVVALLRSRAKLRAEFPNALSSGAGGAFCAWLCEQAEQEFGLAGEAVAHLQAAFEQRPGIRVRQVFECREDLRQEFPMGLTPAGRKDFLGWLLKCGRQEHKLLDEEIWWFLLECNEDPARELVHTYLHQSQWQQQFPDALTVFGQERFLNFLRNRHPASIAWLPSDLPTPLRPLEQVRQAYAYKNEWRTIAPEAFHDWQQTRRLVDWLRNGGSHAAGLTAAWWQELEADIAGNRCGASGLNVLGHFRYPSGLQGSALSVIEGLRANGVSISRRDVPTWLHADEPGRDDCIGQELYDISLIHVQPEPFFETCYTRASLAPREGVYRIGYWYWEFADAPPNWIHQAQHVQELWAPTRFIGESLEQVLPGKVHHQMPGVELTSFAHLPRSHFGLPENDFLFLFMFDMNSITERKNPMGLLSAFCQAFRPHEQVTLVIKTSRGNLHPTAMQQLQSAAAGARIKILDQVMSRDESYALMQACDSYVSLHRSEGFGLTMAESMLMGKPVVATGYSGNMDFMTADNSLLVDYKLLSLKHDIGPYRKGFVWADPSVEDAASKMRWVYDHPHKARLLGARAQTETRQTLSVEAAGRRMRRRLEEIQAMLAEDRTRGVVPDRGTFAGPVRSHRSHSLAELMRRVHSHVRVHGIAKTGKRIFAQSRGMLRVEN